MKKSTPLFFFLINLFMLREIPYLQEHLFSTLALNGHRHYNRSAPSGTSPPLLTGFFVSPLSSLIYSADSTPLILSSPCLPLTNLSLITWDPAPQAQPRVVMETAPHAPVVLNDMVKAR